MPRIEKGGYAIAHAFSAGDADAEGVVARIAHRHRNGAYDFVTTAFGGTITESQRVGCDHCNSSVTVKKNLHASKVISIEK
jgi:hypothetical protein